MKSLADTTINDILNEDGTIKYETAFTFGCGTTTIREGCARISVDEEVIYTSTAKALMRGVPAYNASDSNDLTPLLAEITACKDENKLLDKTNQLLRAELAEISAAYAYELNRADDLNVHVLNLQEELRYSQLMVDHWTISYNKVVNRKKSFKGWELNE